MLPSRRREREDTKDNWDRHSLLEHSLIRFEMSDCVDTDLFINIIKISFRYLESNLKEQLPGLGTLTGMLESITVERMGVGRA